MVDGLLKSFDEFRNGCDEKTAVNRDNKTWLQIILLSDCQNIYLKNYPGKLSDYQIFGKGIKLKDYTNIGVIVDKENIRKL